MLNANVVAWTTMAMAAVALGCGSAGDGTQGTETTPVRQMTAPLTSSELRTLGFEQHSDWQSIWNPATLSQSALHSQGEFSLEISNIGYTAVRHTQPLTSDGSTFDVVGYDIRIPPLNEQVNPWWFGDTWLYIDAPSKGINQITLGSKPLQNPGQFTRIEFPIPAWIRTALSSGNWSDLKFTIAINTSPGNGAHYLDRFTLGPGTCVPTDDGNPCTTDSCNAAGEPTHTPVPAGTACSDSDLCNGAETCDVSAVCQPGTPPLIDDGNPCTTDSCDPASGITHVPLPADSSCSDGNACNGVELCSATAVCTPGTAPPIDDGNPCTADSCDPEAGVQHVPVPQGTGCGNGDACDGAESCDSDGTCQPGTEPTIDDGNPCTADSCDPEEGVLHVPVSAGSSCSDSNACNGSESCDGAGVCSPGIPPAIDDSNPCTADSCDPLTGVAHVPLPSGSSCADADQCNGSESCDGAGVCVGGAPSTIDDGNPCTADSCDPVTGVAHVPLPVGTGCGDDDVCNGAESCDAAAVCQPGTPLDPDDQNPCTADACDPVAGVQHQPTPGATCADSDVCNGAEVCSSAGTCVAGAPLDPDDGNPCTADSCDPVSGVANLPVAPGSSCADADVCNGMEVCDDTGSCQPSPPLDADDGNPCTADACNPITGVQHSPEPAGASCGNGDVCLGAAVCDGSGTCEPGSPLDPDDGNPCTEDSCDPVAGVVHSPVADGTVCNDNNACTQADSCQAGACAGADPVICTAQDQCHGAGTCDAATGLCSNPLLADGTACDDSDACTQGETCTAGTCETGSPLDVDDGNPCTADSCDTQSGALHTPISQGTSCDDGDQCNGIAVCDASGVCQAGTPLTCDDGNACNGVETCEAATGCTAGVPPLTDDNNPCTADSCDPLGGVQHSPVAAGTSCSDGDQCNGLETCDVSGFCQAGAGSTVDDGNPCTEDSCDPLEGVVHTPVPVGASCDLDACTVGGACNDGGFCVGGTSIVPDDGDPCTVETCDPETGVHTSLCTGDRFVTSSVYGSMQFLFSGEDPVQQDVDPSALVAKRMAVILGRVVGVTGEPIPSVRVTVPGHPEFGFTNTQVDGTYQMVVNGSGQMRVAMSKSPYLDVQRQVYVGHGEWIRVPDTALTAADSAVTRVDLSDQTEPFQIHRASPVADSDGIRRGTMLVPAGTSATMHLADGSSTPLETMNIRITEFTVGELGDEAMPAALPPTSAYTYAFEVNADEAVASGAPSIDFDQPLIYYVENFLGVPSGTGVPVGSYDRNGGAWVPEPNGIALSIVGVVGGAASIDVDGDAAADTDAELEAMGITLDERVQLAALYNAGQELWRVPIHHFTRPFDCNFPSVPEDAVAPPGDPPPPDDDDPPPDEDDEDEPEDPPEPDDKCEEGGRSTIECESRTLRESIPIAGTQLSLNYASDRDTGFRGGLTARITLSGPTVPASLKRIDLRIEVAGRSWELSFPPDPDQFYDFTWDTLDAFGRQMRGKQQVASTVSYVYDAVYATANGFMLPPVDIIPVEARRESRLSTVSHHLVGVREPGEENWTISAHHLYDPMNGVIHRGDGRTERALPEQRFVESWPRESNCCNTSGDGGPVESAWMRDIKDIAVGPDGSIYLTEVGRDIRRIAPDGTIDHFAGAGYGASAGYGGDGGPAKGAKFDSITDVEVGADGSVYVLDSGNYRIRKIDPSGIVTTIAGNGVNGFGGDGGPATEASMRPRGIAVGRHGDLYIADTYSHRVRRVTPDGIIHTVGGTGQNGATDSEVEALSSADRLSYPADVAEHPDGSLVVIHSPASVGSIGGGRRVRHYTLDGWVRTWTAFLSEWESCATAHLTEVEVSEAGGLYLADVGCDRIIQSLPGGARWRIAEANDFNVVVGLGWEVYRRPALTLHRGIGSPLAIGPDGVYFAGPAHPSSTDMVNKLYRLTSEMPEFSGLPIVVRSSSGDEVFVFDEEGRHLETRTGAGHLRHAFAYGSDGRLNAVIDESGNEVAIDRDTAGKATRIVSAFGHETELDFDSNGDLTSVTDPAGHSFVMTYNSVGLLETFTDRRDNTSLMTYDQWGRLASDTDAVGGPYTLASNGNERDRVVTNTTAEGRTTEYRMTQLEDGTFRRINTFPDGTQATAEYEASGNRSTMLPSGTVTTTRVWPDPRFGIRAPQTDTTVTLPSGLQRLTNLSRVVELDDPLDLFSIDEEVTTMSINGKAWVTTYDGHALETERVSPEGRWTRSIKNALGQVIRIENPNVTPIALTYDARGRLATTTQGTRVSTNTYFSTSDSRNGYLHTDTNSLGQMTAFERDAIGRVLSQTVPDGSTTEFEWDANGNLTGLAPPGKPEHAQAFTAVNLQNQYAPPILSSVPSPATTFAFNLDRQNTVTWRPDALSFERVYDNAGKLDFIDTPSGIIDYNYFGLTPCVGCAPGSLSALLHPSGVNLAYTYDGHLTTSTTWSGAVSGGIQWSYNNDFRVTTETVTSASTSAPISFAYDDDGLQTCASPTTCPSGAGAHRVTYDPLSPRPVSSVSGAVTDALAYNAYGELASYQASANGELVFSEILDTAGAPRDQLGRIVDRTETNGGTTTTYGYEYDLQGRLIEVYQDGDLAESYTYDDNGNRLSLDTPESSVTATYDDQDRLLTYGNFAYTYTANGELLTKTDTSSGDITAYEYDVFGNLTRVDLPDGDIIEYLVDGRNRRVGKRVNGVLTQQWLWADQLRIAAELDGAGNLVSRFVYGDKPTTPELAIRGAAVYRVIADHLGSVRALVNINDPSDVPVRLDYEAFGSVGGTGMGVIPQGFAGGVYDVETGFVRFGARDYDPVVGRWTAKDRVTPRANQTNQFMYSGCDPVNLIDITGIEGGTVSFWNRLRNLWGKLAPVRLAKLCIDTHLQLSREQEEIEGRCEAAGIDRLDCCTSSNTASGVAACSGAEPDELKSRCDFAGVRREDCCTDDIGNVFSCSGS